ncbi:MAG: helicase [Pirellulaceae bacterium]|nr:MAG: helicase [Pirellulaceae bacterium]
MKDASCGWHVESWDLEFRVDLFSTGWQAALERGWRIRVESQWAEPLAPPPAWRIDLRLPPVRVNSYQFEVPQTTDSPAKLSPASRRTLPLMQRRTRPRPPSDVVTLRDRLYYLLHPPLEWLAASGQMRFPFEPFPYQWEGIAFLYPRHTAILADEMGLGKTMQSITAIRLLLHSHQVRNVLLVCPKPLVSNWKREFGLWAPEVPVAVIEGDPQRRLWQWLEAAAPVKIANYELLMRDQEVLTEQKPHFDLVLLDEAQRIKNRSSNTSQAVCALSRTRCWALTGTPIENSPDDLVGIFEFLSPGYLRPGLGPHRLRELSRDYILRRTKQMVLKELPPKIIRDAELSLTPEQWETYQLAERQGVVRLNELGDHLTVQHVFELILRLKQICNFDPLTGASAKLERLEADLEEIAASGQKAIVFSQWVKTLEWLRERLDRFGPLCFHGRVPSRQRDAILARFRKDPDCHLLLMSYGAGSVGINLQFCQYVFLFDRWWNPAIEDQAINRAHRIGSAGPVIVTRMLALDTVEQRINQILEQKRELFAAVFSDSMTPRNLGLTQDEIFSLFHLRRPDTLRKAG